MVSYSFLDLGPNFGQSFGTDDLGAIVLLDELNGKLTQKDLMPFTLQRRERVSPSISFTG